MKQLTDVMPIFEEAHPDCELHFFFDNSQNHHARPPGGLYAQSINLHDGGKSSSLLRDTTFVNASGELIVQKMQYIPAGQTESIQKGVKTILQERGLWTPKLKLPEARAILSDQDDFKASKIWLQEVV